MLLLHDHTKEANGIIAYMLVLCCLAQLSQLPHTGVSFSSVRLLHMQYTIYIMLIALVIMNNIYMQIDGQYSAVNHAVTSDLKKLSGGVFACMHALIMML